MRRGVHLPVCLLLLEPSRNVNLLCRMSGSRVVENEQLLIDALVGLVGAGNVHVFRGGTMDRAGMERQIAAFRKANIIIGLRRCVGGL